MSTGADATRAGAVFHCLILTRHRAAARALPIEHGLLRAMHNSCGYGLPPQNMQTTGHATCATISSCAAATTAEAQAEPQPTRCPADMRHWPKCWASQVKEGNFEIARSILECKGVTPDASAFTNAVRIPGWSTHPGMRGPSLECGVHLEMRKVNSAF